MPEYIRALIVILVLATVVFYFAKTPATAVAIAPDDFVRRRNAWFYITLAGFLSQNYWVFVAIVSVVIYNAAKKEQNKIALFFFLVLALPQIKVEIPGVAGIRYFFAIDYVRILAAIVLVPVCFQARKLAVGNRAKAKVTDKILAAYIVLSLILQAQYDTGTGLLRSVIAWSIDVVVPYYAISRSVKDYKSFRDVLMSLVIAAMLVSLVGIFEFVRNWLLYSSAGDALGVVWDPGYLARGEYLRASGTSGHSIVLGYVVAIAVGFYFALRSSLPNSVQYAAGMALLLAGILSPLSRGPWVGLAIMLFVFTALGDKPLRHFSRYLFVVFPLSVAVMFSDYGQRVIEYLPFVGTVDAENVTYRKNLFDTSLQIILDNPLFGSTDYLLHMEELRQGQGIIDLVNSFLIVGLNTGFIGLGLYVLFFVLSLNAAFKNMRTMSPDAEFHAIGRALLAVTVGVLAITATVSPIYHVPLLMWSMAGLCLAYGSIRNTQPAMSEK